DEVVGRLLAAMPTPETIGERFFVRFQIGVLFLGSEMIAEQRKAVEARTQLDVARAQARAAALEARRKVRAVQQELWADEEVARRRIAAAEEEARREAEV